jgi:transposase InsO family protein
MKDHSSLFAIERMCSVLKVSRSGYYSWLKNTPSKREVENREILEQIRQIHHESRKVYGSPRITAELRSRDISVSRPRVARLMKKANIRSKTVKKFKVTTDSKHRYRIMDNKLNRAFKVDRVGKVWVSDITYIPTVQGWLYLTIIMDLADRRIIGWSISDSLKASDTVIPAWKMACINRPISEKLIFHSDRGVQYCCNEFAVLLAAQKKVERSMSRKGNCWDNAVAESFFKTIKTELVYDHKFMTKYQAKLEIFDYIEIWYNRKRRHSALGYLSPELFEKLLLNYKNAA